MKRIFPLLLLLFLLTGCSGKTEAVTDPTVAEPAPTAPVSHGGLYDPDDPMEETYSGAVRAYPLHISGVSGMKAMGSDLLVFSDTDSDTVITRLAGEDLSIAASTQLTFPLSAEDPSLQIADSSFSYYDPLNRQTVVLDTSLREIRHIPAPDGLTGTPLLSRDRDALYYCTKGAIRAWNLETGIHRILKEATFSSQSVTGLHMNDTVLQCRTEDGDGNSTVILLSTENGRLLYEGSENLRLFTKDDRFYAALPTGSIQQLLFGQAETQPQALVPEDINGSGFFLPGLNAVVTAAESSDFGLSLEYYDLGTGLRRCEISLPASRTLISAADTADGWVYLLAEEESRQVIYRWDVNTPETSVTDSTVYVSPYYTVTEPDYHGLVWCKSYAEKIEEKFRIRVLLWEDALTVQPWDYEFTQEYLVPVIRQELERLEQRLGQFPEGFLEDTASHFSSLNICIVRGITGSAASGSLETATGIQFLNGTDAYIVIAAGDSSEKALYHELYHVMETHILGNSIAIDQWAKLNPVGFAYDYDYAANVQRDGSEYLQPDTRSFVDTYSMSFPKEDRARIWEYAMADGNEALFAASPLQYKLKILCQGIREAYDLEKSPENFPWEQYLVQPLGK